MATINAIGSNKPIQVSFGGTGNATLTNHGLLVGAGTAAITQLAVATTGQTLMGTTGADPAFTGSPSFSGSVTAATGITATSGAITATSGNVVVTAGNITLPANTSSTLGNILIGGTRFMHAYSTGVTGQNTFVGAASGNYTLTTGSATSVTCVGANTGQNLTTGANNTFIGTSAGLSITQGGSNTFVGMQSGFTMTTGGRNCGLGFQAAGSLTTADSDNICIGYTASGVAGTSNRLQIGSGSGAGAGGLTKSFIHGIRGTTTTNNDAIGVLIDSAGQLGTVSSSIRFKENVQDLLDTRILELRPVSFNYKDNGHKATGLIAEQVEEIMPELAAYNLAGQVEAVKYHDLPVLLLVEIKKLRKELDELKGRL